MFKNYIINFLFSLRSNIRSDVEDSGTSTVDQFATIDRKTMERKISGKYMVNKAAKLREEMHNKVKDAVNISWGSL